MDANDLHPLNKLMGNVLIPLPMVTFVKELHPLKVELPRDVILSGMIISGKEVLFLKALLYIFVTCAPILTELRFAQFSKQDSPIILSILSVAVSKEEQL